MKLPALNFIATFASRRFERCAQAYHSSCRLERGDELVEMLTAAMLAGEALAAVKLVAGSIAAETQHVVPFLFL